MIIDFYELKIAINKKKTTIKLIKRAILADKKVKKKSLFKND